MDGGSPIIGLFAGAAATSTTAASLVSLVGIVSIVSMVSHQPPAGGRQRTGQLLMGNSGQSIVDSECGTAQSADCTAPLAMGES